MRVTIILVLFGLLLVGCGTEPTPQPTASSEATTIPRFTQVPTTAVASIFQVTPQDTPSTRTAPTLPPTFTPTQTPSITMTPTPTDTATATPTASVDEVCARVTWAGMDLDGRELRVTTPIVFWIALEHPSGVLTLSSENTETGDLQQIPIPAGGPVLFNATNNFEAGNYIWSISVTTNEYTAICEESSAFTLLPEPEPNRLAQLLQILLENLLNDAEAEDE